MRWQHLEAVTERIPKKIIECDLEKFGDPTEAVCECIGHSLPPKSMDSTDHNAHREMQWRT